MEQGKFTELTSAKIYEIRKQIRTPSKIIFKSQNQLKEEVESIKNYTEKIIQQLKWLYDQNKVIKEKLKQQKYEDQNRVGQIKVIQHIQTKMNVAHKLLGLNQNGSRFFTMINDGVIEKQLEKILEKINLNEESINQNKKAINDNKQAIELRIKKLTETVAENTENLYQKMIQKMKENCQRALLKTELNIIKFNLLSIVESRLSNPNILLKGSSNQVSQTMKQQCISQCCKINQNINKVMKDYHSNVISSQQLNQELKKLETHIQQTWNQLELKINMKMIKDISMFFTKEIKKLNLLYIASENNFQVSKFWDKCNGKTNTITFLKTQFGKIIGGYNPLAWNKSLNNYQQDTSKQTFLFSVTQKHKIPIQNQVYASYHTASQGPSFGGGHDLCINNNANVTGSSYGNIGHTYNNGEYKNQEGYKKWTGQSSGSKFLIQQWEVYEITFE